DLVAPNLNSTNLVMVRLALGDGTFPPVHNFVSGNMPRAVALADMDQNGLLDAVVANEFANRVVVLPGLGDGTFASALPGNLVGERPTRVAVGDLDLDGVLDVVALNSLGSDLSVLLGLC